MKLETLSELLVDQLKDLHSAETQLTRALPKLVKRASSETLKSALAHHLEETRGQVERLDTIATTLGIKLSGKKCKAMEGLIEEGAEVLEVENDGPVIDLAIIAAAQRVEHYEMSAYGTARELAAQMGHKDVVALLQETLEEESAADEKLTTVAEELYPEAPHDKAAREPAHAKRR